MTSPIMCGASSTASVCYLPVLVNMQDWMKNCTPMQIMSTRVAALSSLSIRKVTRILLRKSGMKSGRQRMNVFKNSLTAIYALWPIDYVNWPSKVTGFDCICAILSVFDTYVSVNSNVSVKDLARDGFCVLKMDFTQNF